MLGRAVVPDLESSQDLYVALVGSLGRTPLAALRTDGALVIARRPIARVLSIVPRQRATQKYSSPVILGDPSSDLPGAAREAFYVARELGTSPFIGPRATAHRILSAGGASVLHVAAHTSRVGGEWGLRLANGVVTAADVLAGQLAPRLVVLASCGTAAAVDDSGWGSLAAAFLTAGSEFVVAVQWSVTDGIAAGLIERFYANGGARRPVRALAAAQVWSAATSTHTDWVSFTVLAAPPPVSP